MTRKFVVLKAFTDLVDKRHVYNAGDFYPREGVELDEERAELLASADNARKESLIVEVSVKEAVEEDEEVKVIEPDGITAETVTAPEIDGVPKEFPVHTGGGYYELSNGNKVQGKHAAIQAEKELGK